MTFSFVILVSPLTAFAGQYFNNGNFQIPQNLLDEVDWIIHHNQATLSDNTIISCDNEENIYLLSWPNYDVGERNTYVYNSNDVVRFRIFGNLYQWDYDNKDWESLAGPNFTSNFWYCSDSFSSSVNQIAAAHNLSGDNYFAGSAIIWYNTNDTIINNLSEVFPLDDYNWSDPSIPDYGNGYNDSSFKSLVSDLFDHLFEVLLYGEDEGYDSTDVDDSVQWLEDLSDDMEDITIKLNQAPNYIRNGFTAVTSGQTAINDFFTGISTAIPILYYGIVGILTIIIIRKIIGR